MIIRPYQNSDLPQIIGIYHDAVHVLAAPYYNQQQLDAWAPSVTNASRWHDRLSQVHTIVMDAGGVIAGFASYEMNGHLDLLFTHPNFARKGVARDLCAAAERALCEAGLTRCFTEASLAAKVFFESQGFKVLRPDDTDCRGVVLNRYAMDKQIGRI